MATLSDILSPVWTLSLDGGGAIAEGLDAIKQCLNVIVRTTKGTDPLRPEFGCDLYHYADQPLNVAIPAMKKAMLDAIAMWESRVTVTSIAHALGDTDQGQVKFILSYSLVDGTLTDSLALAVSSGGVVSGGVRQRIILRAYIPENSGGSQYQIAVQLNGADILPDPPSSGFSSLDDLYGWVQENWLNYGQWYLTGDSLVGYMNPAYNFGSSAVSLLTVRQISATIPSGGNYSISIVVNGVIYINPEPLYTLGDMLAFLSGHTVLGQVGTWQISTVPGDFEDDFSEDFDTFSQSLQLITNDDSLIQISITAE